MYDVGPEQYATVIRDLIKHENELTNHRIMWLLVIQGLLVNAYVGVRQDLEVTHGIAVAGILVSLSAFVLLYQGYHARKYLQFLGREAKLGKIREEQLPFDGWPKKRIRHWRRNAWVCPWLERAGHLLEPFLALPMLIVSTWLFVLLEWWIPLHRGMVLGVAVILAAIILSVFCIFWVRLQSRDEEEHTEEPVRS